MAILGQSLISNLGASQNLIGAGASAVNTAKNLSEAFSKGLDSPGGIASAMRSIDLPAAGEAVGDIVSAVSTFGDDANADDWRVRLSLPSWPGFRSSPVLAPLKDAGGLIFPYTPNITLQSNAKYTPISTVHTNYNFQAFQSSDPGTITITAPMNVEDQTQGIYWVAAIHYLRSLTKMFAGSDPKAGNPPPVVFLNGYGNYVFKNIPVVVTNFTANLDDKCDYIGVPVVGSAAGAVEGVADSVGGLTDSLSGAAGSIGGAFGIDTSAFSGALNMANSIAGGIGQVAALAGSFGIGGSTPGGITHVPTKSTFTVTLQPMYSRNSARKFSLDRFVQGGYLNNSFGYI
jgi:hypothetical protein